MVERSCQEVRSGKEEDKLNLLETTIPSNFFTHRAKISLEINANNKLHSR